MLTLKQVNKALIAKNIPVRIVRGEGYFYFLNDKDELCEEVPSYYVFRLSHTTLEEVLEHVNYHLNKFLNSK